MTDIKPLCICVSCGNVLKDAKIIKGEKGVEAIFASCPNCELDIVITWESTKCDKCVVG